MKNHSFKESLGFIRNHAVARYIATLDPMKDHSEIVHLLVCYEFHWDMVRSLEIALMRTFTSPRISGLLHKTGEFHNAGQKRYDDTGLLVAEFMQNGYESERGQKAIEQINRIHGHYNINNLEYLYVLSTFVLDPIRWIEKYGWRKMSKGEKTAYFEFFRQTGIRMNIKDIPATLDELVKFSAGYEQQYCHFHESNRQLALATTRIVENWFPRPLRPFVKPFLATQFDPAMRKSLGYGNASPLLGALGKGGLKFRALALRLVNLHSFPALTNNQHYRSYPKGYQLSDLVPDKLRKNVIDQ